MDTNKMREQFEVWAAKNYVVPPGIGHLFVRAEIGDGYRLSNINHAWRGWQASREAVVVELGAPSHWVADYAACGGGMTVFDAEKAAKVTDPMCSKTPSYTIHALEKAGLKVAP